MPDNSWTRPMRAVGAIVTLLFGLMGYGLFSAAPVSAAGNVGEAAPDVTLHAPGGEFRLSQQQGRVLVLFFTFPG